MDGLRAQLDRTEAGREAAGRRADAVGVELRRAKEEADALRQTETDRKARGLARLRAAWRGE